MGARDDSLSTFASEILPSWTGEPPNTSRFCNSFANELRRPQSCD